MILRIQSDDANFCVILLLINLLRPSYQETTSILSELLPDV